MRRCRGHLFVTLGAEKGHLVLGVIRAQQQTHAIVVRVAVHARATLVHRLHEAGVLDRALAALLWRLRRRGAAVVDDVVVPGRAARSLMVRPLLQRELAAGAVAADRFAGRGVHDPEVHIAAGLAQVFGSGAGVEGERGAVHNVRDVAVAIARGALLAGLRGHLELERQRETIDKADVHPVHAVLPEARLELGVHRRGAAGGGVAVLAWASALADAAPVAVLVAPHLGPVARAREVLVHRHVVGCSRCDPDVLRVGADAGRSLMRNPDRLATAAVCDPKPRRLLLGHTAGGQGSDEQEGQGHPN
mmetsp:Transcript_82980/g.213816  ORF Transcript_82980/g.213816 Transcript_82980/m.213816 type:complete len:304 (+) Transcript_82980:1087-1998(+)